MAIDFEGLINKHAGEGGVIPADAVGKIASAISSAVGREFVDKARYNAKLDEIETLKTEKQTAEDNATTAGKWEKKYNDLKSEYDTYKQNQSAKEQLDNVKAAYKKLLEANNIDSKRFDVIMRATQFDKMKLGADGKLEGEAELTKAIDADWADFKVSTRQKGADVEHGGGDGGNSGANTRAAELAKMFHERRYGKTPENKNE